MHNVKENAKIRQFLQFLYFANSLINAPFRVQKSSFWDPHGVPLGSRGVPPKGAFKCDLKRKMDSWKVGGE